MLIFDSWNFYYCTARVNLIEILVCLCHCARVVIMKVLWWKWVHWWDGAALPTKSSGVFPTWSTMLGCQCSAIFWQSSKLWSLYWPAEPSWSYHGFGSARWRTVSFCVMCYIYFFCYYMFNVFIWLRIVRHCYESVSSSNFICCENKTHHFVLCFIIGIFLIWNTVKVLTS